MNEYEDVFCKMAPILSQSIECMVIDNNLGSISIKYQFDITMTS